MKLSKSVQKEFMTVTSLSKFIAFTLFIIFPFVGFFLGMQYQHIVNQNQELIDVYKWNSYKTAMEPVQSVLGKYTGSLPCADCDEIRMELTLYVDGKTMAPRTFVMKETFVGQSLLPIETTGTWNMLEKKNEPEKIVYQLNADGKSTPTYYLNVDDESLLLLDENQNEIKSRLNYVLNKE